MSLLSSLFGGGSSRVDGARARQLVDEGALLLDVRTPAEFDGGHLPGAVNVPVDQLEGRLGEVPEDRAVVVYCRSGGRSARAAGALTRAGRGPVYDLGGIGRW